MWDENDSFAHCVQLLCAVPLLALGAVVEYYDWTRIGGGSSSLRYGAGAFGFGCLYLGIRCLWYAITGRDNINNDELNNLRNFFSSDDFQSSKPSPIKALHIHQKFVISVTTSSYSKGV